MQIATLSIGADVVARQRSCPFTAAIEAKRAKKIIIPGISILIEPYLDLTSDQAARLSKFRQYGAIDKSDAGNAHWQRPVSRFPLRYSETRLGNRTGISGPITAFSRDWTEGGNRRSQRDAPPSGRINYLHLSQKTGAQKLDEDYAPALLASSILASSFTMGRAATGDDGRDLNGPCVLRRSLL